MNSLDHFRAQLSAWGLDVGPEEVDRLTTFAGVLAGYERANVIGTRDRGRVLLDHVLDSLSCLLFAPLKEARAVADVGSGGGLPGIPIRIALPGARVALFESSAKKTDFLRHAIDELGLEGTETIRMRVEEAGHENLHRSHYDVCTARAVARLSVVAEYCVPLVEVGGYVISMKSRPNPEEMREGERAAETLGARVRDVIEVPMLPEIGEKERRLVILEKVRPTPERYPRKPGTPAKNPLGIA